MSRGAWCLVLVLLCAPRAARARAVTYTVQPNDTAESVAADYYGNRSLAHIVLEANGLERGAKLRAGTRLRIPTAFRYRVKRGETLEALAQRFCEDRRRAAVLAQIAGLKPGDKLREGQELLVPFNVAHRTDKPESLSSIARDFYGDGGKAKLLADYNFRSSPLLAKGERVLVPIAHVKIRAVYLQPTPAPATVTPSAAAGQVAAPPVVNTPPVAPASEREAQRREVALAARVGGLLVEAEKAYKDGNYAEVSANLDKLLSEEDPSEVQLAEIFRLKAFSYVALGMDDLAERAFREVLARRPGLLLDEATVSPKIRGALDRAKKAVQ